MELVEIDGSFAEGGGSLLRHSLALSILTGKGFVIDNIRVNRPVKGLSRQHLVSLNAAVRFSNALVEGHFLGSTRVKFVPSGVVNRGLEVDIGTAGSVTLLLQSLLLPAIFNKGLSLRVRGGTDVAWSPPIDFFVKVFLPYIKPYADVSVKVLKRGYFPKGGGEVVVNVKPLVSSFSAARPLVLDSKGKLLFVRGVSHASLSLSDKRVAERQASAARITLGGLGVPVIIDSSYSRSDSPGSGVVLWAVFDSGDDLFPRIVGADALGERSLRAEVVGERAAKRLLEVVSSGAVVDELLADQLIPLLGLVGGRLFVERVSDHSLANIYLVEKFLGRRIVVENNVLSCVVD